MVYIARLRARYVRGSYHCIVGHKVGLAYAMAAVPALGVVGIWWSIPIGWLLADALGIVYYWIQRKKTTCLSRKVNEEKGKKPMIILITGASLIREKTRLAQQLLEKLKFPYLSIDHLKMGLIRSGQTQLTPCDDAELTPYLWSIVKEMIKTAIENRQNLIVEGCYIPFDWKQTLKKSI